jgi:ATP-dependent protease ClpP protease subunit
VKRFLLLVLALGCASSPARRADGFTAAYRYTETVDVGDVDEESMAAALLNLSHVADSGAKRVTLRIDSAGGSVFLGMKWIRLVTDLKKAHSLKVTCIVDGTAYSMGAVILESPVCDTRLATVNSTLLFHNGSGGPKGTEKELESARALLRALNAAMAGLVAQRLHMPVERYQAMIADGDWAMAAVDALANHALDGVIASSEIAPPAGG